MEGGAWRGGAQPRTARPPLEDELRKSQQSNAYLNHGSGCMDWAGLDLGHGVQSRCLGGVRRGVWVQGRAGLGRGLGGEGRGSAEVARDI